MKKNKHILKGGIMCMLYNMANSDIVVGKEIK